MGWSFSIFMMRQMLLYDTNAQLNDEHCKPSAHFSRLLQTQNILTISFMQRFSLIILKVHLAFWLLFTTVLSTPEAVSQSWVDLNSGTDYILFDLSFPPGQSTVGYAAGMQYTWDAEGIVIKTTDGGDTWTTVLGGAGQQGIEAMCFTTPEKGFVAGWNNYFARTEDGGQTWTTMNVGNDNWLFLDMDFYDANHGAALATLNSGGMVVYVTADGGASWQSSQVINQMLFDLTYADATTLYAAGSNETIVKSTDGGLSWTVTYAGSQGRYLMGIDFRGNFGVAGGEDGKILYTTTGGLNWNSWATGYHNFEAVHVFNADSAYVGGTDEDVYKTTDGGASWTIEDNAPGESHIYKIKFTDDKTGFLCGSQGMLKRKAAPAPPLMADFTADNTQVCTVSPVQFFNQSTGQIESYSWTFEGGVPETSAEANPVVYFPTPGQYDVTLTVHAGLQQHTVVKENYIESLLCEGVEEFGQAGLSLQPNPAKNEVRITGLNPGTHTAVVTDASGRQVLLCHIVEDKLDVSALHAGLYFLTIRWDGQSRTEKLLIR